MIPSDMSCMPSLEKVGTLYGKNGLIENGPFQLVLANMF
jgi:hypothetical protein